ncbi:MAG: TIGR01777 family oxidoreductase [Micromonosporaceae bacterium]|nr:TIGR01777 family oxidoreductase [Micromonosporaceae bacterium]
MRIVIGGSSGFIGTALVKWLRSAGHEVVRLVRRAPAGPDEVCWRPNQEGLDPKVLNDAYAAINLAGVGVGDHRWTAEFKKLIRSSRVNTTQAMAVAAAQAARPPRVLLNSSGVHFYGDTGDHEVDEAAPAGAGFMSELCQDWEAAAAPAEEAGIRVVHLRTGLILGRGGLLRVLLPLFRFGLGGRLGGGKQWMPCMSLQDAVAAIGCAIEAEQVAGPVNLVGPAPVRNTEFTATLGRVLRRPAVLPVPAWAMRLAVGEYADQALTSLRVVPGALLAAGYRYRHPDLESALRWAVHGSLERPVPGRTEG